MDSLISFATDGVDKKAAATTKMHRHINNGKSGVDAAIIQNLSANNSDSVNLNFQDLYKSLSIEAQEILNAINKELGSANGVHTLKPEESTPEATAERIVSGVTGLFSAYQTSNNKLDDEEVLEGFMKAVRRGVKQGYDEAFKILDGLGAFQYDGVQSGVEKTLELVNQKLDNFEKTMRQQLGITATDASVSESASTLTRTESLLQGGASLSKGAAS